MPDASSAAPSEWLAETHVDLSRLALHRTCGSLLLRWMSVALSPREESLAVSSRGDGSPSAQLGWFLVFNTDLTAHIFLSLRLHTTVKRRTLMGQALTSDHWLAHESTSFPLRTRVWVAATDCTLIGQKMMTDSISRRLLSSVAGLPREWKACWRLICLMK